MTIPPIGIQPDMTAVRGTRVAGGQDARRLDLYARLRDAGRTPEEAEAVVSRVMDGSEAGPDPDPRGVALSKAVGQGILLGAGDEARALVSSLTGGPSYREALAQEGAQDVANRRRYPVQQFAGELAGGAMLPIGFAANAAKGAGTLGRAAAAGAGAAAMGGVSGAASAPPGARGTGAMVGAGLGGALGAAGGAIGQRAAGMIADRSDDVLRAAVQEVGPDAVRANLAAMQAAGRGGDVMLADVLGRAGLRAARGARTLSSAADETVSQRLGERASRIGGRVRGDVQTVTGGTGKGAFTQVQDYIAQARERAKPFYDAAKTEWAASEAPLDDVFQLPVVQQKVEGLLRNPRSTFANANPDDFALWDEVYKQLGADVRALTDKAAKSGVTPAERSMMTDLIDQREMLREAMAARAPSYRTALAEFADEKALQSAFEEGLGAAKMPPDQIAAVVGTKSPSEKTAWLNGYIADILDDITGAAPNPKLAELSKGTDVVSRVFGNEKVMQRIDAAFGEGTFDRLLPRLRAELQLIATNQGVRGNSATADKMVDALNASGFGEAVGSALEAALTGGSATGSLMRSAQSGLGGLMQGTIGKTAQGVAEKATRRGDAEVRALIDALLAPQSAVRAGTVGASAGRSAGLTTARRAQNP